MPTKPRAAASRSAKPTLNTKPKRTPRARKPVPIAAEISEILAQPSKPPEPIATILPAPDVKPAKPSSRFIAPVVAALVLAAVAALTTCTANSALATVVQTESGPRLVRIAGWF